MKKMISILAAMLLSTAPIGCALLEDPVPAATTKNAYVVTVGVQNGFAGKCPGSKSDCTRMKSLLSTFAKTKTSLVDKQATKAAILAAMSEGIKNDLFIFYFSGHGGSTPAKTDSTEVDKQDEFICCYDTILLDNDIWAVISKAKGRVVLIFDCCYSGTMFRARKPVNFERQLHLMSATSKIDGPISMICWSGCQDNEYSWGSSNGGYMTNKLRSKYKKTLTYDQVWSKIESDKTLKRYQTVQCTKMGKDFGSNKVFQ